MTLFIRIRMNGYPSTIKISLYNTQNVVYQFNLRQIFDRNKYRKLYLTNVKLFRGLYKDVTTKIKF